MKYGMLTIIGRDFSRARQYVVVACDCGTRKSIQKAQLTAERPTRSCGCMRRQWLSDARLEHGASLKDSPLWLTFVAWQAMLWRCYNVNRKDYKSYGGRGIKVCTRWRTDFPAFLDDMGKKPPRMSLGRINNNGPYSPENCRWETPQQQARNKRTNRILTLCTTKRTLAEWAELTGIKRDTIGKRLEAGWTVRRALTEPLRGQARA